jgi:site-specific recombinase XerD
VFHMSARGQRSIKGKKATKSRQTLELNTSREAGVCLDERDKLEEWCSYLTAVRGRTKGTAARYRHLVERLLADTGSTISSLDRAAIEGHLRRLYLRGLGGAVRQGVIVAARSLGEWALAQGLAAENPAAGLVGPRPYRSEIKVLTVAEVRSLIWPGGRVGHIPRDPRELRDRTLLAVTYMAGLRASEIGPLETDALTWNDGAQIFALLVRKAKHAGGDQRLPLDREVSRLLGTYLVTCKPGRDLWGRPLTRGAVRKILHRRIKAEGIAVQGRRMSPHILRHSLATHLLKAGHDIRAVQMFMRHRSISTTELYLHLAGDDAMARALARRSPLSPPRKGPQLRPALQDLLGELRGLIPAKPAE